jgi:hypothetical protein
VATQVDVVVQIVQLLFDCEHGLNGIAYSFSARGIDALLEHCNNESIATHTPHFFEAFERI